MDPFLGLDTPALWAAAVGFFSPPVISVIQQAAWSARRKSLVAFAFYLVTAAMTAWFLGQFNVTDIGRLALLIFLTGATSYMTLWKPTGTAAAIETATSSGPSS